MTVEGCSHGHTAFTEDVLIISRKKIKSAELNAECFAVVMWHFTQPHDSYTQQ